jgi:hypothetical protein
MSDEDKGGKDWSDREVDLIVADYFDMRDLELLGKPAVKIHRNKALQELTGRSKGSVEFKHRNISAILHKLGEPWIIGYKPLANYQQALLDSVERFLDKLALMPRSFPVRNYQIDDPKLLYVGPSPKMEVTETKGDEPIARLVRKFDPALRDERNRELGRKGEEYVFKAEKLRLSMAGLDGLAKKVRWVSNEDGDGAGFDILSFDSKGNEKLLEVKTTSGHFTTPFYISRNEKMLSQEKPDSFKLLRLYDFAREPKGFQIDPPLDHHLVLEPTNYRASFSLA